MATIRLPIVEKDVARVFLSLEEHLVHVSIHRDMPLTVTFRRLQCTCTVTSRMSHRYVPILPVNRRPLESCELSMPHACSHGGECHFVDNPFGVRQHQRTFVRRQEIRARRRALEPNNLWRRSRKCQPLVRCGHTFTEDCQSVVDGLSRCTVC